MRPLSTVEKPTFQNMLKGFGHKDIYIPDRRTLTKILETWYNEYVCSTKTDISTLNFMCTTTDIWSSLNKSYLGMTLHYIDSTNLLRVSKPLACKRVQGSHTYLNIDKTMNSVHKTYGIDVYKVPFTVTDNGSNFVKAFNSFSVESLEDSDDYTNVDVFSILNREETLSVTDDFEDEDEIILPNHMRCSAHTLNLIATTDASKAIEICGKYKQINRSAFAKIQAFWNLISRSTVAADSCESVCGTKFPIPNKTRWNSTRFIQSKKYYCTKTNLNNCLTN